MNEENSMIPAPPGLAARYKHEGKTTSWRHLRVIAFGDDSAALVVSDRHRIERADQIGGFDGFTDLLDPDVRGYSTIMGGGGWRAEFTSKDGSVFDEPLIGWALKDGMVVPLVTDCEGLVEDGDAWRDGTYRVYHPGQRETPADEAAGPDCGHNGHGPHPDDEPCSCACHAGESARSIR